MAENSIYATRKGNLRALGEKFSNDALARVIWQAISE